MRPVLTFTPASARRLRISSGLHPRHVHGKPWASESVKEKLSSLGDKVNKKVGEGLGSAIETGGRETKKTLGETVKEKAKGAKKRADHVAHKAKEAGNDVTSEVKEIGKKAQRDV